MLVFIAAGLHQLRDNLLGVDFFKGGNVAHFRCPGLPTRRRLSGDI
jgi:hypothetical protein